MKIDAYYQKQEVTIPKDFDAKQFFDVLEEIYPDKSHVTYINKNFKVSARPLDSDFYSVMLCDPKTDEKNGRFNLPLR